MKAYNKFILPLNFLNYLYFTSFFQLFFITLVFRLYIYIMLVMLGCIRSTTSFLLLKYCKFSHFQNYIFIMNFYSIYHSKRGNLRQVAHFKQNNNYSKSR
jgi:cellulose synthase/poly-beta-1,6-N-acetylglucosamine synthase-like glycosyltransferase